MKPLQNISIAHSYVFDVEKNFDTEAAFEMAKHKWHYSLYWCALYIVVILSIQKYMKNRSPFQLQATLFIWNIAQVFINALGLIRCFPEFSKALSLYGFQRVLCDEEILTVLGSFWLSIFGWSKLWELCDTLFIVFRKRQLTFLHVIHHSLTLIITWYFCAQKFGLGVIAGIINCTVHSFMYFYYAIRALNVKVPDYVPMSITILQMVQLFALFSLPIVIAGILMSGQKCNADYLTCFICFSANGLYFCLFTNYFYRTHVLKRKSNAIQTSKGKTEKQH